MFAFPKLRDIFTSIAEKIPAKVTTGIQVSKVRHSSLQRRETAAEVCRMLSHTGADWFHFPLIGFANCLQVLRDRERVLIRAREASTGRIVEERFDDVVFACGAEVI